MLYEFDIVLNRPFLISIFFFSCSLSDEDKIRAREALQKIRRAAEVREYFTDPVNERKYYDYSYRVEVPMNFTLIDRRLNANYYSTKYSLVADVKLIRDNCLKYNGEVGGLQDSARKMYEDFENEMLSAEERSIYHDLKLSVTGTSVGESGSRSSLANLPPPESQADERRRSLRIRIDIPQAPRDTTRHTRSHPEQESANSIAFANASRGVSARQTRRRSNERVAPAPPARQQNVAAGERESPGSPSTRGTRQSSRVRESLSSLEAIGGGTASGAVAASSPARRTRSHDAAFRGETHEEDSSSGSESDAKPAARPTRRSARSKDAENSESSNESESESETEHKSSTRPTRGASRRGSRKEASSEFAQRKRKTRGDSSDSEESEEEEEEAEDESDASPPPAKRAVRGTPKRTPAAAPSRSSSRARTQGQPMSGSRRTNRSNSISYAEQSESEFDEVLSDSSEDEDPSPKKRAASRTTSKRPAARRQPTSRSPRSAPKRRRSQGTWKYSGLNLSALIVVRGSF